MFAQKQKQHLYWNGEKPASKLWRDILPGQTQVWIIAQQPMDYFDERSLRRWLLWITPFANCLGHYLRKETKVCLDVDAGSETKQIFKKFLPHGFEKTECPGRGSIFSRIEAE